MAIAPPIRLQANTLKPAISFLSGTKIMRVLLILIAIVLLLSLIGWVSFSRGPDRSSINFETNQIRTDSNKAMESGADLLHKAGDKIEKEAAPQKEQAPPVQNETTPVTR
jgi:hypothetical protein